ncbi:hypothetical protein BJX65DRAFT_287770 [Aspergillus insuetus]
MSKSPYLLGIGPMSLPRYDRLEINIASQRLNPMWKKQLPIPQLTRNNQCHWESYSMPEARMMVASRQSAPPDS